MKLDQEVDLWPGKAALLGTLRPETSPEEGAAPKIIVVFARAWEP
jgi:hypothetical protein